jgi:BirA family biotin operon repressor/biotin-[acetyl-CoA-carboxylase] ligase
MGENDNMVAELSASVIEQEVTSRSAGTADIVVLDSVGSTNSWLQEKLANNPPPAGQLVLCATEHQTAGRGRRGKTWHTPRQGVTFSTAFSVEHPVNELSGLSLLCGVAVCRSLHEIGVSALLKWPNDILLQESKLAGILVEIATSGNNVSTVIIGIGLNYRRGEEARKIDQNSTDLVELLGENLPGRSGLIGRIAASVFEACRVQVPARVTQLASDWSEYDALAGRTVNVEGAGALQTGVADGIDATGQLRVLTADGVLLVSSGNVSVRPA